MIWYGEREKPLFYFQISPWIFFTKVELTPFLVTVDIGTAIFYVTVQ